MILKRIVGCWFAGICLLYGGSVFAQDLQVTALSSSTTSPKFGQTITLKFTVTNTGARHPSTTRTGYFLLVDVSRSFAAENKSSQNTISTNRVSINLTGYSAEYNHTALCNSLSKITSQVQT